MTSLNMIVSSEEDSGHTCNNMSIDELTDRLHVMQYQESTHYRCANYIDKNRETVDRDCRVKMTEWCYQVTDFCKFKRETVAVSMSYLDRFLSTLRPSACRALQYKKEYQLAAMTCLYIAIKLFEPLAMDTGLLSSISQGCYSESDISDMEKEILTSLGWRMNGPTSHDFLSHILEVLPSSATASCESIIRTISDFSRFQVELAVSDYDLAIQKPSIVALAAILNSAEGVDSTLFRSQCRRQFLHYITNELSMDPFSAQVNAVRIRLLRLFSKNSCYEMPQIANFTPVSCPGSEYHVHSSQKPLAYASPVSVARNLYPESTSDRHARCA
ncbi:hypothetical protein ACHAXN_009110 [Cyclotella atomus]